MSTKPRIVFFGTPDFAVPSLVTLANAADVVLVVTQPDRKKGRGKKTLPPPVKIEALELDLPVLQPDIVKGKRFASRISAHKPDFIVTAAFGKILGPSLLQTPKRDCLNVHASLLPRHRGAAPANWTIIKGDPIAGVSIMQMDLGLDKGGVYMVRETPVEPEETAGELLHRIAKLGAEAVLDTIMGFDSLVPAAQNDGEASWAPKLKKEDGVVDWTESAMELHRRIRGLHPWPCASTLKNGAPLKIHASRIGVETGTHGIPGTVLRVSPDGIDITCGRGVLRLIELQSSGKKRLSVGDFIRGSEVKVGDKFGA